MTVDIFNTDKKYSIIYADPPWSYNYLGDNFDSQFTKSKNGFGAVLSAKEHYNTMTNKDIMELPIKNITDKDCLLFMWVTNPLLEIGMKVLNTWEFEYKTIAFIWYKEATNPGFYTMSQCEICIVAKKGNIPKPRGARNIMQFHSEKRGSHSRKPHEFRRRINQMFPEQKKIELFARKENGGLFEDTRFDGWDIWGNEC